MDKKIIQQFGQEILSFRLQTKRQKKRKRNEAFEKKLLQLDRERSTLLKMSRALGWEPLIPPVQKGWIRFFVLRDDVAGSRHALLFQTLLEKINTRQYYWRKDFKHKKRRRGKKIYVVKPQYLRKIYAWEFNRFQFTEWEREQFIAIREYDKCGRDRIVYVIKESWRFVLRVQPNVIDKVKVRDIELEKRSNEISAYLERNYLRCKLNKLKTGNIYKYHVKGSVKYNE
ncbi:MAG: hypothetical protein JST86_03020 [Bacteroidetes bacterium]|nr:hypothetical protein [Bacteroidota bacterium]